MKDLRGRFRKAQIESCLQHNVIEVENIDALRQLLGWEHRPSIESFPHILEVRFLTDANYRRIRDAEVLAAACCNEGHTTILEIGTSKGQSTALMALNAPEATIHTVNIPPDEISKVGKFITYRPELSEIGSYYRERSCANVRQILANTAKWEPDIDRIDVAFIDGCHDAEFVFQDTEKILRHCRQGGIILWHDFNPALINMYDWIADVCLGITRLYQKGFIQAPILHLKNSWIGLYRIGGYEL